MFWRWSTAPVPSEAAAMNAPASEERDSRISSVCSAFPCPAPWRELLDELRQVVCGTGPGRVAPEARAELAVAQELLEQLPRHVPLLQTTALSTSAALSLRRVAERLPEDADDRQQHQDVERDEHGPDYARRGQACQERVVALRHRDRERERGQRPHERRDARRWRARRRRRAPPAARRACAASQSFDRRRSPGSRSRSTRMW